jgi:4-hydroxyphenylpyruvate dioxygenase-like putative hemolysin
VEQTITTEQQPPTNIVSFPKKSKRTFASLEHLEEMKQQVIENKIEFVEFVVEELVEEMLYKLNMIGFDFADDDYIKDGMLIVEGIKSLILKSMGIDHPLQETAEKMITIVEDKEKA